MSIQLIQTDFDQLITILENLAEWRTEQSRIDLLDEIFHTSPRKRDVLRVRLDGTPRQAAGRVIQHLAQFGQDEPARETLLVFTNGLCAYVGEGSEMNFLRGLPQQYGTPTQPINDTSGVPHATPATQAIRDVLVARFDLDDMHDLCFQLNIKSDDVRGDTRTAYARELVMYLERRGRLSELVALIRRLRGNVI